MPIDQVEAVAKSDSEPRGSASAEGGRSEKEAQSR